MKKLAAIIGLTAVFSLIGFWAFGGITTIVGSMSTVNNTTFYTSAYQLGTVTLPSGTFVLSDGGTTATNALTVTIQVSFDQTNFVTVGSWNPPVTNAGTWSYNTLPTNMTCYVRGVVVTTNSVQVGGFLSQ